MKLLLAITTVFLLAACCQHPVKLDPDLVKVEDICFEVAYFGNDTIGMVEKECEELPEAGEVEDLREIK